MNPATFSDDTPDPATQSSDLTDTLAAGETEYVVPEEKKRLNAGTVAMFAMVLAARATYFMMIKAGPSSAAAKTETVAASKTIDQFLNDKGQNIKTMQTMLRDTESVVRQFLSYPSTTQVPLSDLATNPFRAMSVAAQVDEDDALSKRKRDGERLAALNAVQTLRLQSVMYGDARRACMVNGQMVSEGQSVDSFVVERINTDSVVVRKNVYRYEIRMTREK